MRQAQQIGTAQHRDYRTRILTEADESDSEPIDRRSHVT